MSHPRARLWYGVSRQKIKKELVFSAHRVLKRSILYLATIRAAQFFSTVRLWYRLHFPSAFRTFSHPPSPYFRITILFIIKIKSVVKKGPRKTMPRIELRSGAGSRPEIKKGEIIIIQDFAL